MEEEQLYESIDDSTWDEPEYENPWMCARDLDTITEVSESSHCSSALRSYNIDLVHRQRREDSAALSKYPKDESIIKKSAYSSPKLPLKSSTSGSNSSSMIDSGLERNQSSDSPSTSLAASQREQRFLMAYQRYHQSDGDRSADDNSNTGGDSSDSSVSFTISDSSPTMIHKRSAENIDEDANRRLGIGSTRKLITPEFPSLTRGKIVDWQTRDQQTRIGSIWESPMIDRREGIAVEKSPSSSSTSPSSSSTSSTTSSPLSTTSRRSPRGGRRSPLRGGQHWSPREEGGSHSCIARATSQAILNRDSSSNYKDSSADSNSNLAPKSIFLSVSKILAQASSRVEHANPYVALAKATIAAASKALFESCENLHSKEDGPLLGTVSLVVSSTLTTTKKNLLRSIARSTPDLIFRRRLDSEEVEEEGESEESNGMDSEEEDAITGVESRSSKAVNCDGQGGDGVRSHPIRSSPTELLDSAKIKKLLSPPYYSTDRDLDETFCSGGGLMNDTFLSTTSTGTGTSTTNNTTATRPSSRTSWKQHHLWDYHGFRREQTKRRDESERETKSERRNKYKSKIDKAKSNYLQQSSRPNSEVSSIDDQSTTMLKTIRSPKEVRLSAPIYEATSTLGRRPTSKIDLDRSIEALEAGNLNPPQNPRTYDDEYERIVETARRNWASGYQRRADQLRRDQIDEASIGCPMSKSIVETDVDRAERESRSRNKDQENGQHRAKSADCVIDKKSIIDDLRPPENELRNKLLLSTLNENKFGEKDEQNLSEHELRFRKSLEKLHVPEWYLYSQYFARGRSPPKPKRGNVTTPSGAAQNERPRSEIDRSIDRGNHDQGQSRLRIWDRTKSGRESRKSDQSGMKTTTRDDDGFYIPKDFFVKYKEEIEELRKSRTNLAAIRTVDRSNDRPAIEHATSNGSVRNRSSVDQGIDQGTKHRPSPIGSQPSTDRSIRQQSSTEKEPTSDQYNGHRRPVPVATVRPTQIHDDIEESNRAIVKKASPPDLISNPSDRANRPIGDVRTDDNGNRSIEQNRNGDQKRPPLKFPLDQSIKPGSQRKFVDGCAISIPTNDWNVHDSQNKVVVGLVAEVEAVFHGSTQSPDPQPVKTLEEILDSLISADQENNNWIPSSTGNQKLDTSNIRSMIAVGKSPIKNGGIFAKNAALMEKCARKPSAAVELLKHEPLWIQCAYCRTICPIPSTRNQSVLRNRICSCPNCYTYYCNSSCRYSDAPKHVTITCTYARVTSLCRRIHATIRQDPESIYRMSLLARAHFAMHGRGTVDFRFPTSDVARGFVENGWKTFDDARGSAGEYLKYRSIDEKSIEDPQSMALSRSYDPRTSFLLNLGVLIDPWAHAASSRSSVNVHSYDDQLAIDYIDYVPPIDDRLENSRPTDPTSTNEKSSRKTEQQPPPVAKKSKSVIKSMFKSMGQAITGGHTYHVPTSDRRGRSKSEQTLHFGNGQKTKDDGKFVGGETEV